MMDLCIHNDIHYMLKLSVCIAAECWLLSPSPLDWIPLPLHIFLARHCVWPPPLFPRAQDDGTPPTWRSQGGFRLPPDGRGGFQSVASPSPVAGAPSPLRGGHQDHVQLHTTAAGLLGHTPGVGAAVWTLERDQLRGLTPAWVSPAPTHFTPSSPLWTGTRLRPFLTISTEKGN